MKHKVHFYSKSGEGNFDGIVVRLKFIVDDKVQAVLINSVGIPMEIRNLGERKILMLNGSIIPLQDTDSGLLEESSYFRLINVCAEDNFKKNVGWEFAEGDQDWLETWKNFHPKNCFFVPKVV